MTSTLDLFLQDALPKNSLFRLTDAGKERYALPVPVTPGTRVAFVGNLGALLAHDQVPVDGMEGTVVMVRTAMGDKTTHEDHVFVKWDDGRLRRIHRHYLRAATAVKTAVSRAIRAQSLGDLSAFFQRSGSDLIHKATRDLWSLQQTEDGNYRIDRLFQENGEPIKV